MTASFSVGPDVFSLTIVEENDVEPVIIVTDAHINGMHVTFRRWDDMLEAAIKDFVE